MQSLVNFCIRRNVILAIMAGNRRFDGLPRLMVRRWLCSASEAGSYLRLIDSCITQLKVQGLSLRLKEEEEKMAGLACVVALSSRNRSRAGRVQLDGVYLRILVDLVIYDSG